MALVSTLDEAAFIIVARDGGAVRSWNQCAVNGPIGAPDGFTRFCWTEIRVSVTKRWVGLSYDAANTYYLAHLADSAGTTTVGVRYYCDDIRLKSFTLEMTTETLTLKLLSTTELGPDGEPVA